MLFYIILVSETDIPKFMRPSGIMRTCCVISRTLKLQAVVF